MKKIFFEKEHFTKRLIIVILAVITMGFSLTWLKMIDYGTDPCTLMNLAISSKIGLSFGNWQAIFNTVLLILVIILGASNLKGGAALSFMLLIPALIVFVFAAAIYMDVDMGTAPYDAIPFIISTRLPKISFKVIRMSFDFIIVGVGILFGGKLGIVTVLMALTLGPVIAWVGKKMEKFLK